MAESTPKVTQVAVTSSVGGKIQIVQFQYTSSYFYSVSKTYDVDMTDAESDEFWKERVGQLREELEPIQQKEIDSLQELRDELTSGND